MSEPLAADETPEAVEVEEAETPAVEADAEDGTDSEE